MFCILVTLQMLWNVAANSQMVWEQVSLEILYIADMHVKKNATSLDAEGESGHAISNLGNEMSGVSLDGEYACFPFFFLFSAYLQNCRC